MHWRKQKSKLFFEGNVFKSNSSGDFIVTEFVSKQEVHIKFLDTGYETIVGSSEITRGQTKDCSRPSVFGVGVTGEIKTRVNGEQLYEYILWCGILRRCYGSDQLTKSPSYEGCTVSENFKYFPYFKEWCNNQIGFGIEGFDLDKDLLIKGNKVYSENVCIFLPRELNQVLVTGKGKRGKFPIGVGYLPKIGKFRARLGEEYLGVHDTSDEAFCAYKQAKESYIKLLANKWRDQIDPIAYNALMSYQVEITD